MTSSCVGAALLLSRKSEHNKQVSSNTVEECKAKLVLYHAVTLAKLMHTWLCSYTHPWLLLLSAILLLCVSQASFFSSFFAPRRACAAVWFVLRVQWKMRERNKEMARKARKKMPEESQKQTDTRVFFRVVVAAAVVAVCVC